MKTDWTRKIGLGALVLVLGMLIAACGSEEPTATPQPQDADDTEPAAEEEGDEYFSGKRIRVIIPYAPGGSSSVLVPYFSHQLQDYIPGGPRVVSTHVTPIIAGYNYLHNAPTDGSEIMYTSSAPITQQYAEGSEFDVGEFEYLLGYTSGASSIIVNGDVPYDDLTQPEAADYRLRIDTVTDPSEIVGNDIGAMLAAENMGFGLRMIPLSAAATGTAELLVAMERGDIDGQIAGAIWYTMPSLRPGWTEDGTVKPVGFLGRPGEVMQPNTETDVTAPNLTDIILDGDYDEQVKRQWRAFVLPDVALGKHFLVPPGTDPEALEILRQAFSDMMADEDFVTGLERLLGQDSVNVPGAELQELIEDSVDSFAQERDEFEPMVERLYNKYTAQ